MRVRGDAGERRVHFMRHAGGEKAEGSETLFVLQLALESHAIGDVADHQHARAVGNIAGIERARCHRHFFFDAVPIDEVRGDGAQVRSAQLFVRREEPIDRFVGFFVADQLPERAVGGEHSSIACHDGDRRRRRLDDVLVVLLERADLFELAAQASVQTRVLDRQRHRRGQRLEQMHVVARQRLFAALRAEEEKTLELAAIAQGKDVAISGAKKFPRNVAGVRKSRIGEDERRCAEIAEVALGRPSRHILFRLIDEQRSAFAREEIHLLDVQCRAEPFAHHRDQLVHIVECRQLLREVGHGAAMSIAVAIEHALDH